MVPSHLLANPTSFNWAQKQTKYIAYIKMFTKVLKHKTVKEGAHTEKRQALYLLKTVGIILLNFGTKW